MPRADGVVEELSTDFHVLLSSTRRVPVLYFSPHWVESSNRLSLEEVYRVIVEGSAKKVIEEVGVMGGISHGAQSNLYWQTNDTRIIHF